MGAHSAICAAVVVLCRYGCQAKLPREQMAEHAKVCVAIGQPGKFPVCDGYCRRRCPLHFDMFAGDGPPRQTLQRPKSANAARAVERKEWMICRAILSPPRGSEQGWSLRLAAV